MANNEERLMDAEMERFIKQLEAEEVSKAHGDPVDVATILAFTAPREHRTMGKVSEEKAVLLALIAAKGAITKSRIRSEFVENYLLMSRSANGWGSEQAASVAKARAQGTSEPVRRGILSGLFRRRGNDPQ